MNLFDSHEVPQVFVDQEKNREVKYIADKVLHIAELPINRIVRENKYVRIELTREEIEDVLRSKDTIILPFNLKGISVTNKEQLERILCIMSAF